MSESIQTKPARVAYLDILRIIAAFAIVMIHASTETMGNISIDSSAWNAVNVYDSLSRWGVPVFVMISGALFLEREHTYRKLFCRNILHMAIAYLFWSVFYAVVPYLRHPEMLDAKTVLKNFLDTNNYLWFLLMMIGIYLIVPMLKRIVENEKIAWAFVILFFVFAVFIPQTVSLIKLGNENAAEIINGPVKSLKMNFVLGFPGYFILGYLLHKNAIKKGVRITLYALGILGAAITIVGTSLVIRYLQKTSVLFYDNFAMNVFFVSTAVFVAVKQICKNPMKTQKAADRLAFFSKCTFGVYLIHPILITFSVNMLHIDVYGWMPYISIPIFAVVIFAGSYLISIVMNKIPIVKKWLV
ncbi:MAG: acyltransferase family protein [Ruminococcus sp.]|nr:acyltransferase family protein [Ruminococcus sp.]